MRTRALSMTVVLLVGGLAATGARADGATDVAGVPAALVGDHGPTQNYMQDLELVGHSTIPDANGLPLGNNGAPALIGDCAYVGRWHDYSGRRPIQILNIADPTSPTVVGGVPDSARTGGVAREIRAIDLPGFRLLVVLTFSQSTGDRVNNKLLLYTFPADGDCTKPVLAGTFDMRAYRGHEFFLWLDPDPAHNVDGHPRALAYVTAPIVAPNIMVVDVSRPAAPQLVGVYEAGQPVVSPHEEAGTFLGSYAHSISVSADGREAYLSYGTAASSRSTRAISRSAFPREPSARKACRACRICIRRAISATPTARCASATRTTSSSATRSTSRPTAARSDGSAC